MLVKEASEHNGHNFDNSIFKMHILDIICLGIFFRLSALSSILSWYRKDNETLPESVVTQDHICVSESALGRNLACAIIYLLDAYKQHVYNGHREQSMPDIC